MADAQDYRKTLLIELYKQLWNSTNTRLNLTWESIGILVGAFAIFALTEKRVITLDYATALIVLIAAWFIAHVIDMSYWFNRNLAMIVNVERQFLNVTDARLLYPYFLSHRKGNRMVSYLRIQAGLGIGLGLVVTLFHFMQSVVPVIACRAPVTPEMLLPYIITAIAVVTLCLFRRRRNNRYADFIKESPGEDMAAEAKKAGLSHLL
jgi:hypothetical protein